MLVSRVACLGKIRHQAKPYSGPLSRHLLAYQSLISSVRSALRDLLEMILAAMFLEGSVNRERDDWMDLSLRYVARTRCHGVALLILRSLPLYDEHSCALGNLTLHYLDELCTRETPTADDTKKEVKDLGQKMWITKSRFSESLDDAFHLWDAVSLPTHSMTICAVSNSIQVYKGVQTNGEGSKEVGLWDEVNDWLSHRR